MAAGDETSPDGLIGADPHPETATIVRATGIVAVGMMTMNVLAYGFTLLAAHLLGPEAFGGVSALLGVLIVTAVGALALQATAARRLATCTPAHQDAVIRDVVTSGARLAGAIGLLLLVLAPVLDQVLHLDDLVAALAVAVSAVPLTLMGVYAGVTQGLREWSRLAAIYIAMGLGRLVCGVTAMLIDPSMRSAMIGVAVGSFAPPIVGAFYVRTPGRVAGDHTPVLGELWRNGHILLAFFVFTNLDVLLARHLFEDTQAGIYAAGAILAKTCLFLPTFVLVVAFPTMATDRTGRPWLKPMLVVLGLGALAVLGTKLLPGLAVAFAGGSEYDALADVAWLFALEGTIFAALQILVYDTIAGQSHSAYVLWLGSALTVVLAVAFLDSVAALVSIVTVVAVGVGLVTSLMPGTSDPD